MSKQPTYDDTNRKLGDTVRRNYSVASFGWDDGHYFFLVPRQDKQTGERSAELHAYEADQAEPELALTFDVSALKSLRTELDSLISWAEANGDGQ